MVIICNGDFIENVMQRKSKDCAAFDVGTLWHVCTETIGLLSAQKVERNNDCEKGKNAFHGLKSLFNAAKI